MADKATTEDFVARDDDGDSLTVEGSVEIDGEEKTVEAVPATRGLMNELDNMDPDELESEGMRKVLANYRSPDFRDSDGNIPKETIDAIPMVRLNKLFEEYLIMSGVDEEDLAEAEEMAQEGNLPTAQAE